MKYMISLLVVVNLLVSIYLFGEIQALKKVKPLVPVSNSTIQIPREDVDLSSFATKDYVDKAIVGISKKDEKEASTVVREVTADSSQKTTILPISATFSTQNRDWTDVPNSDFYLDLASDYSEAAVAVWEAFIHEQHGNGKAYARLYDVTHNIGVVGSEIETNSSVSNLQASAGTLAIWRGKNLYRVQIKSEKGFAVFFNSGRLKISY